MDMDFFKLKIKSLHKTKYGLVGRTIILKDVLWFFVFYDKVSEKRHQIIKID